MRIRINDRRIDSIGRDVGLLDWERERSLMGIVRAQTHNVREINGAER